MKKVTFFIIMIVSTLLCSCGTTANYASADSWEDGIYYRKSQERTQEIFTDNKEIEDLVHKTKRKREDILRQLSSPTQSRNRIPH